MTFFSQEPDFFTETEIALLHELCEDISFAFETIDMEASQGRILSELEQSRRQLVNIINFLPEPTFAIDRSGTIIIWNQAMEILTGVGAERGHRQRKFRTFPPHPGDTKTRSSRPAR